MFIFCKLIFRSVILGVLFCSTIPTDLLLNGQGVRRDFPDLKLTSENSANWREHILPSDEELAFTKIPWLPTLQEGVLAADKAGKPVLLWTMNGHPLANT